jgi:hypothetical protein
VLVAEGGYGETLQFCRYGALLKARGIRSVLVAAPRLITLLRTAGYFEEVLPPDTSFTPAEHLWLPLLSLPRYFGTDAGSIPAFSSYLGAFAALASVRGVKFVSLQKEAGAEQLAALASCLPVLDFTAELDSLLDAAALVMSLSLVITTDLAATPPWYPSMRLFRQRRAGDWASVMEEIRAASQALAAGHTG